MNATSKNQIVNYIVGKTGLPDTIISNYPWSYYRTLGGHYYGINIELGYRTRIEKARYNIMLKRYGKRG